MFFVLFVLVRNIYIYNDTEIIDTFCEIDILYHIPKYTHLRQDQEKIFTFVHVSWDLYSFIFLLSALSLFSVSSSSLYCFDIIYHTCIIYIWHIQISYYLFHFICNFILVHWISRFNPLGFILFSKISHHRLLKPG